MGVVKKGRRMTNPLDPVDIKDLAPTGVLRGGVVVAPVASALFAVKDAKGVARGVTVDLLRAFAETLKLPLEMQLFSNSGQATDRGGKWRLRHRLHAA
jgi:polar amino acid transport system substrate-binding protein